MTTFKSVEARGRCVVCGKDYLSGGHRYRHKARPTGTCGIACYERARLAKAGKMLYVAEIIRLRALVIELGGDPGLFDYPPGPRSRRPPVPSVAPPSMRPVGQQ